MFILVRIQSICYLYDAIIKYEVNEPAVTEIAGVLIIVFLQTASKYNAMEHVLQITQSLMLLVD